MNPTPNPDAADLPFSAAADRNKRPILAALERLFPASLEVLEIASGTGQHAQFFAGRHRGWSWQPSDADPTALPLIDARCAGLGNVRPALRLDVLDPPWPPIAAGGVRAGAVYCANLLHISPWETTPALVRGAAAQLEPGGLIVVYGPFRVDGVVTAPSNEAFDADLRVRDPRWGLRSLSDVQAQAAAAGFTLQEVQQMPANNLLLAFRLGRGTAPAG